MEFPVENQTQGGIKKFPISIPKKNNSEKFRQLFLAILT